MLEHTHSFGRSIEDDLRFELAQIMSCRILLMKLQNELAVPRVDTAFQNEDAASLKAAA